MNRRIITVITALLLAAITVFAGCGKKSPSEGPDVPLPTDEPQKEIEKMDPYTGLNAETIYTARDLANGINAWYTDELRTDFHIENQNMQLDYNLSALNGAKLVTSLKNTKGLSYFENSADAYVVTTDGKTYYASNALVEPSLNIYRHGFYYYQIHILGQELEQSNADKNAEIINVKNYTYTNQLKDLKKNSDGTVSMAIDNSSDPYICWEKLSYDTSKYKYLSVTLKTSITSSGEIYLSAGSQTSFNPSQVQSFTISNDGLYHTYVIDISSCPDYTGKLTGVRIDYNGASDGTVTVKEIKLIEADDTTPAIRIDRQYHAFSDKINSVVRFLATETCDNIAKFVTETVVPAATVDKIIVKDYYGEHDTLEGIDWQSTEFVGFDIKDTGIFGYILLDDEQCGHIEVVLDGDNYRIIQAYVPKNNTIKKEKDVNLGQRYYTDESHDFVGLINEAFCERHPLTELTTTCKKADGKFRGYNALWGVYEYYVNLKNGHFQTAYYNTPDKHYNLPIEIQGDNRDRTIYIYTVCEDVGELECAAILDGNSQLIPVKVEVCKNFRGDGDETIFEKGDQSYCNTFFPVYVKANEKTALTVVHLYMNWGQNPLRQLSSIMFFAPYYHLSLGTTETNCIAPFFVHGKDLWTIPDFRPLSAPLWKDQPQHTSGGCPRVFSYTDDSGTHKPDLTTTVIDSSGPSYADVTMNYVSDDGKISASYRHLEMPQTDENRAYYDITLKVNDTIKIADFTTDFSIAAMDSRCVFYKNLGYLDKNNKTVVTDTNTSDKVKKYILGTECPYFDIMNADSEDYVNMAIIVKDYDIVIGGKKFTGNFTVTDRKSGGINYTNLSLDLGKTTLKAGDYIKLNLIIMPFGSQESTDDASVLRVRENTCLNPITISTDDGEVQNDPLMPKVISKDNKSVTFTISGGADNLAPVNEKYYKSCCNNIAVRAYRFTSLSVPKIYELIDGQWQVYEIASENGYDGYTVFADEDNTFSYAFVVDMSKGLDRTFKVEIG